MDAKYILLDDAVKAVEEADVMCDIPAEAYRVLQRYVERIQIADVAPVIYAKWNDYPISDGCLQCSNCGILRIEHKSNYCPNCGAKMQ